MSLLAPLYFLGALAIGLPILFHLIRRQPKGEVEFSSLMFLKPTPPRLTRRSRLDNLPLLLMRALALILLAAAFARPFLRQSEESEVDGVGRRIVIAIDTSASMRRADLWRQAKSTAEEVIADVGKGDQLSIVNFDDEPKVLLGFSQSTGLTPTQLRTTATKLIKDLTPTWRVSDLGRAVSFAADLAVTHEEQDKVEDAAGSQQLTTLAGPAHLVLVTDMQSGSKMESLQVYAWPDTLSLDVRKVGSNQTTNAWAQIMKPGGGTGEKEQRDNRTRVRVSNSSDALNSHFRLIWKRKDGKPVASSEMPVQVPPGESRVVPMSPPDSNVVAITVLDDDHAFDNDTFVVNRDPVRQKLLYFGPDESSLDPKSSLFYYLSRVPLSNRFREVSIESIPAKWPETIDPKDSPLVVVASGLAEEQITKLKNYIQNGGRVLIVLSDARQTSEQQSSLVKLTDTETLSATEATVDDYVMLSRIKFADPVFASMSDPQFNDFTKIRFWRHRKLTGVPDQWKILATYDDDDPALIEIPSGKGKIWILTTGWQPEESQLALSTKFIPMVFQWFESSSADSNRVASYAIGEPIAFQPSSSATITRPDGSTFEYKESDDHDQIDRPGIYVFNDMGESDPFAVNIAESESHTDSLDDDALERFGVKLGAAPTAEQLQASGRQLRDIELEGRQKIWQWLLLIGLVILLMESWLGGWLSRDRISSGTT